MNIFHYDVKGTGTYLNLASQVITAVYIHRLVDGCLRFVRDPKRLLIGKEGYGRTGNATWVELYDYRLYCLIHLPKFSMASSCQTVVYKYYKVSGSIIY